jgi:hypothetical protein
MSSQPGHALWPSRPPPHAPTIVLHRILATSTREPSKRISAYRLAEKRTAWHDATMIQKEESHSAAGSNPWRHFIQKALNPGPYWLTRFAILRLLGLVYSAAFLTAALQLIPLVGENGLTPVSLHLQTLVQHFDGPWNAFFNVPTIFYLGHSDEALLFWSWAGVIGSLIVLAGYANGLLLLVLWILYMSINHIGQVWYGFGWEIQLLETGFLAIFLCPFLDPRPFTSRPPPVVVIWLYRWLIFRIMLGAGLIKIRGDECWRDLTCLVFHYETQPIPHPLSWLIHQAPIWFHQVGVLFNHLVELVLPFFIFGPTLVRRTAGLLMLSFQVFLILSGNLSFLNWLTIIPILACLDDGIWRRILPKKYVAAMTDASQAPQFSSLYQSCSLGLLVLVAFLSVGPVQNLLSSGQAMNTSFDRLHLVNTYGAFGTVGKERPELVFAGTTDAVISPETIWKEYDFKCKPDRLDEAPCLISPYHLRLDWLLWFAAMGSPDRYPWVIHLVYQFLENNPQALSLIKENPFEGTPPQWVRVERHVYYFTRIGDDGWWAREKMGSYIPPLQKDNPQLLRFISNMGWAKTTAQ